MELKHATSLAGGGMGWCRSQAAPGFGDAAAGSLVLGSEGGGGTGKWGFVSELPRGRGTLEYGGRMMLGGALAILV